MEQLEKLNLEHYRKLCQLLAELRKTEYSVAWELAVAELLAKAYSKFDINKYQDYITYWENKLSEKQELNTPASVKC